MLSPKITRTIYRIIPFGLIWLIFGFACMLLVWGLQPKDNPFHITGTVFSSLAIALALGLLLGAMEILYLSRLFRKKSFSRKIIYKAGIYWAIIVFLLLIGSANYTATNLRSGFFTVLTWTNVWSFYLSLAFIGFEVYLGLIIVVSLFYTEVSEYVGQGVLVNFLTGRYHRPVEEERIYMFLDMKSSTTIAEKLGHVMYFEMLREYYADITGSIIKYFGEIYQYVGDEVIVSWTLKKGIKNNNCIRCFFAMKTALEVQSPKYKERYGLSLAFKAGFHLGKVTTGEIGVFKKDIMFTGDTLNTTSRIQALCNVYNVDILISEDLGKKLDLRSHFQVKVLGEQELRGRDEKIELITILPL